MCLTRSMKYLSDHRPEVTCQLGLQQRVQLIEPRMARHRVILAFLQWTLFNSVQTSIRDRDPLILSCFILLNRGVWSSEQVWRGHTNVFTRTFESRLLLDDHLPERLLELIKLFLKVFDGLSFVLRMHKACWTIWSFNSVGISSPGSWVFIRLQADPHWSWRHVLSHFYSNRSILLIWCLH